MHKYINQIGEQLPVCNFFLNKRNNFLKFYSVNIDKSLTRIWTSVHKTDTLTTGLWWYKIKSIETNNLAILWRYVF